MSQDGVQTRQAQVRDRIRSCVEELSPSQRKVAQFLVDHPEDAAYLSSARLGALLGVSESTVIRLAARLGFEGYPDMQRELHGEVRRMLGPAEILDRLSEVPADDVFSRVFRQDIENLAATAESISYTALHEAVEALLVARHIYVVGMRRAYPLAYLCAHYLNQSLLKATLLDLQGGTLAEEILPMGSEDLLIAISFPRYAGYTMRVLRYAKRVGCRTVAVTDSELSPVGRVADIVLSARYDTQSPFASNVAGMSVVAALAAAVSLRRHRQARDALARLDILTREFGLNLTD